MRFFEAFGNVLRRMGRYRLRNIYGKLDGRRKRHNRNLMIFHYILLVPIFYTFWFALLLVLWGWYWILKICYLAVKYFIIGIQYLFWRKRNKDMEHDDDIIK